MCAAGWLSDMSETTKAESPPTLANRVRLESIPAHMVTVRDYLQEVLPPLLRVMFEKTDDAFFQLAEKAQIVAEQKIYFNAKKEMRVKRRTIEASYLSAMYEVFHLEPETVSLDQQSETQRILNNSSIDDPMFRVLVVLNDMVEKTSKEVKPLLEKVIAQINGLMPGYALDEYNSPLSIYTLSEFFLWSCECLAIETEEKIIVLNMFEKYVLTDIERILNRIHRLLLDGEIANLAIAKQKNTVENNSSELPASTTALPLSDADPVRDDYQYKKQLLIKQLCELQQESLARVGDINLKQIGDAVNSIAHSLHIESNSVLGKELRQASDLMGMLFGFLLSEAASSELAHWLNQLYIPLLRAVLIDMRVLSSEGHAVRRLLNEIANTSHEVKPNTSIDDDLFRRYISRVVERITKEFDDDLAIFPELLVDFTSAVDDERKRQKIIRERMREIDCSAEALEKAKIIVEKKLARLCKGKKVPIVIADFLHQYWATVLYFAYLKEGDKSPDWNKAIDIADFIVESVLPENKGALLYQLPTVLEDVNIAMQSIGATPSEIAHFFTELELLHLQQYQVARTRAEQRLANKPTEMPVVPITEMIEASVLESIMLDELTDTVSVSPAEVSQHEVVEDRFVNAQHCVSELRADMWLEFYPEPDHKMRVKIATILKPSQRFILVDRDGKKIAEKTNDEMVNAVAQGALRLLDATSLFGKALALKRR